MDVISTKFKGQKRYSGLPSALHSLRVGALLCRANADTDTILAGLMHDLVEDTETTVEEVRACYGNWFGMMSEVLTKESTPELTHVKLLEAAEYDQRCLTIKIYDRLDNMRELAFLPRYKQKRISRETLHFYVPVAKKLVFPQPVIHELQHLSLQFI